MPATHHRPGRADQLAAREQERRALLARRAHLGGERALLRALLRHGLPADALPVAAALVLALDEQARER